VFSMKVSLFSTVRVLAGVGSLGISGDRRLCFWILDYLSRMPLRGVVFTSHTLGMGTGAGFLSTIPAARIY